MTERTITAIFHYTAFSLCTRACDRLKPTNTSPRWVVHFEPAILFGETGRRMLFWQLSIDHNMDVHKNVYYQVKHRKGCRKKCTRQSRKALWVILSSLFKEIWKNWHERPWKCVCECYKRKATKVGSTAKVVSNSVSIISHITFRDYRVHIFHTTFLEIAVCLGHQASMQFPVIIRKHPVRVHILL